MNFQPLSGAMKKRLQLQWLMENSDYGKLMNETPNSERESKRKQ